MSDQSTLIIVPTYNEKSNVVKLIEQIYIHVSRDKVDLLFIDDGSPDGTADLIEDYSKSSGLKTIYLIRRPSKLGLGSAYRTGFAWGLQRKYDQFLEMDADLSHDPKYLPAMLKAARNFDCVLASRYSTGGGTKNWPFHRQLISRGGCLYAKTVLGVALADLTGGFNLWSRKAVLWMDIDSVDSEGYVFQIELKYRALLAGLCIAEVPFVFVERSEGVSKMSSGIFWEALYKVWLLRQKSNQIRQKLELRVPSVNEPG